jgi:acyl CoA:acetate/3-ketoacid CoA transferase alpha subunit/acyl CoA:acetate/3-ketoacid CoA transferase beta subunit
MRNRIRGAAAGFEPFAFTLLAVTPDAHRELREWIARRFAVPGEDTDKTRSLSDAVAENVRPGDALYLGMTHTRFSAGVREVLRQFHGTDPGFTLIAIQMTTPYAPLVHAGLARSIVTSWSGDSYYTPGPNPVFQRAWASGVEFEHWSILSLAQRLAAGARGLEWTTTRSLLGSDMERDNAALVRRVGDDTLLVRSLVPDVGIVHAAAADPQGNALVSPPLMEGLSGALAARRGTIVTAEKIVDPAFIRAHAHLARIPASCVSAVVEAPMGGHPGGMLPTGIEGIEAYGEDYEFWVEMRRAARDPADMDTWIKEWVLDCETHAEYIARLGSPRVEGLRKRNRPESWREEVESLDVDLDAPATAVEWAIAAASRVLKMRAPAIGATAMLAGAGMANLAAWLAAYDLAAAGHLLNLVAEMGLVGYWPRPADPMLFNQRNFPTCTMLADIDTALGVIIGGARARSLGSMGAAQVDRFGNINSTLVPGESLLMGSGGANDVATCATETVLTMAQSRERFLERVPYVTAPGERVVALVSTLGVYEKDQGELVLTRVFGSDVGEAVRECRALCGWDLRVARDVSVTMGPSAEELRTLRLLDPQGWFRT